MYVCYVCYIVYALLLLCQLLKYVQTEKIFTNIYIFIQLSFTRRLGGNSIKVAQLFRMPFTFICICSYQWNLKLFLQNCMQWMCVYCFVCGIICNIVRITYKFKKKQIRRSNGSKINWNIFQFHSNYAYMHTHSHQDFFIFYTEYILLHY